MQLDKRSITLISVFLAGVIIFYFTSKIIQILTPIFLIILVYFIWKH